MLRFIFAVYFFGSMLNLFSHTPLVAADTLAGTEQSKPFSQQTYARFIIPSVLISYGVATRFIPDLQDFDHSIRDGIQSRVSRKYTFDDYIQYAPWVGVYVFDWVGVKAKHNIRDRTILAATSALFTIGITQASKYLIPVQRPNGGSHSFPSGHTSTAFAGAHLLFREYSHCPYIYVPGYAVAALTGSMRMVNNRHWLSDVITGAGVGILSVEASYLLLPYIQRLFKIKNKKESLTIVPMLGREHWGVGAAYVY